MRPRLAAPDPVVCSSQAERTGLPRASTRSKQFADVNAFTPETGPATVPHVTSEGTEAQRG